MLRKRVVALAVLCTALCGIPLALVATIADAASGGAATGAASPRATGSGGGILFPIPTQGPPRQFPITPTPPPPPPPASSPPPSPAPPPPTKARPRPKVVPSAPRTSSAAPKPTPIRPKPTPRATPPQVLIPLMPTHTVPHRKLSTEMVVFVVAIVPVSLARVRR